MNSTAGRGGGWGSDTFHRAASHGGEGGLLRGRLRVTSVYCFSELLIPRFLCKNEETCLAPEQVCDGLTHCPMVRIYNSKHHCPLHLQTDTSPGGEDEDSEECEGSGQSPTMDSSYLSPFASTTTSTTTTTTKKIYISPFATTTYISPFATTTYQPPLPSYDRFRTRKLPYVCLTSATLKDEAISTSLLSQMDPKSVTAKDLREAFCRDINDLTAQFKVSFNINYFIFPILMQGLDNFSSSPD